MSGIYMFLTLISYTSNEAKYTISKNCNLPKNWLPTVTNGRLIFLF